ncbi:RNA-directed DNA polymerase from mobile element jockey [Nymphon striatum]|nr:RNA-directed DNA polymerase from mobile element jockey [Nymphon striatum]
MANQNPHPLKRTRSQSDIGSLNDLNIISPNFPKKINRKEIDDNSPKTNNIISDTIWPRFLVIHQSKVDNSKSLSNLSPFAINKVIISLGGEPKSVKKLFSGDILVETQSRSHTSKLLKTKSFFDIPVTVTPHSSLNYSKGVIRSRDLKDCSEEELLTELADQGVTAVKKIIISKNKKKITTGTIIFTFNTPEPPKSIKAAYLNIKVERYIPNPLRCFKCQKFGHHQTSCKGEAACGKCGGANHSDDGCENASLCLNCKGNHPSFSRECPNFLLEKQVVSYKYNFNTTFPEARKIVLSRNSTKSYAHVTASNAKKDASTQTDPSWQNPPQKVNSTSQTQNDQIDKPIVKKSIINRNKNTETEKQLNKNKTDKKKESAIPTPSDNNTLKNKTKTYDRVVKPLTPTQLRISTESIDFPPMDVIRSAAEAQETSDNDMDFVTVTAFAEISDQYSEFITILLEVADISIPKTSQYPKRFNKPWFNKDCKDAVRERKRLLRKFSLRPTSDNLSCYRQAAAAARRTIRQAKRESWRQYVSKLNSQSSIKSAWDRLRKIRGKGTSDAYKHLNVGGTAITSQLDIANALGQSFCRNSSSDNCTGSFRSYKNRAESQQLDFKTTNTEVYNQVFSLEELRRSLRASKDTSPGPDSIHYQMLKHLPDCSLALILNIFNTIWITGAIPSSWLEATVIPIPKPGKDHTDPLNYRPIALTSCICKTMERMINCRLTYYLETNNILTRYQSGFRRQRSTIDHLVRFETLVREAFVRREHLAAVFFDLEKAYETTWKALNLLRILSNTNWGADRKVMLRFYRSLIRSKLDYGSVVYGSARKSYLRVLDPVHNQGLRLSLGAFRTTPAESLYVEAHEPSLYLRREKLSLQYACRLRANPENPCYDVTFHPNHRETFARRQNSIPTFGLRVLPLFEQIGLPLGNIARCVLPSIPPWTMHRPIINFSLTGLKKGTTPSYVYLYKFLEVSDSYHGYHHIYTDGSRQNDEVAAAAISTLTSLSSRLPDKSSIFSAESKALLLALDIVENSTYGRYIILSDSLSCLMALDNMKYSHPTICEILLKLHTLSSSNHVIFCWLPSHVGISGNEKADFAAKSALSLPVDHQFISYHDFYMYILKHILSIWQSKWDGEINNKLHAIKPKLGEWALAYRKSRKEESILCRLRVGHTYLTHSFLLRNEAQPVCGRCQLQLTVRHVLVDCAALTSVRSRFYSPPPWEEFFQEVDILNGTGRSTTSCMPPSRSWVNGLLPIVNHEKKSIMCHVNYKSSFAVNKTIISLGGEPKHTCILHETYIQILFTDSVNKLLNHKLWFPYHLFQFAKIIFKNKCRYIIRSPKTPDIICQMHKIMHVVHYIFCTIDLAILLNEKY